MLHVLMVLTNHHMVHSLSKLLGPLLAALLLLSSMLASRVSSAQVVNVLNEVPRNPTQGIGGQLGLSANWRSGNSQVLDLAASATAHYRRGRHLVFLSARVDYGVKSSERYVSKDIEHLRYRIHAWGPLAFEALVQHDRDEFRRRELRMVMGAGPRLVAWNDETMGWALGVTYLPELVQLGESDTADSGQSDWTHRLSGYSSVRLSIGKRLQLDHTLFGQPALGDWLNVRVLSELGFAIRLAKHLQLRLAYSLQVDTEPPDTVRPADAQRKTTLKLVW